MSDDITSAAIDQHRVLADQAAPVSSDEKEQTKAANELARSADNKLSMHVKVYSPFQNYYDDQALSISGENATGPFDVLPRHHNFISLLGPSELLIRAVIGEDKHIQISGGIMHVKADRVIVFLDV